jgi:hypothetical protein
MTTISHQRETGKEEARGHGRRSRGRKEIDA